jgi:MarR family transcriptional regulator, transcriptional regulator for hemolysin
LPGAHADLHGLGKITLLIIPPVPDQPDILFLLHDIARLLRVKGDRRARAHGMTRAQWVILWQLERQPGLSQKELAEILEVEPITVARLVDRLAARGMLERRDDPADRRIWRLHLLPPALPVLAHMHVERAEVARLLGVGLPPETVEAVRQALIAMKANVLAETRSRPADAASADAPPARSSAAQPSSAQPSSAQPSLARPSPARRAAVPRAAPRRAAAPDPDLQQDRP